MIRIRKNIPPKKSRSTEKRETKKEITVNAPIREQTAPRSTSRRERRIMVIQRSTPEITLDLSADLYLVTPGIEDLTCLLPQTEVGRKIIVKAMASPDTSGHVKIRAFPSDYLEDGEGRAFLGGYYDLKHGGDCVVLLRATRDYWGIISAFSANIAPGMKLSRFGRELAP